MFAIPAAICASVEIGRIMIKASQCLDCGAVIDWDGDGGIIWLGDVFCESCDPLEPKYEPCIICYEPYLPNDLIICNDCNEKGLTA